VIVMRRILSISLIVVAIQLTGCAGAQRMTRSARLVRLGMAEQLAERGQWTAAFEASDALIREDPSDAAARLVRGKALRHQGMLTEAAADVQRVVAEEPRNAAAHAELAIDDEELRKPEDALMHHREAHRLAPDDPRFANNLAFALILRGKPREAVPLLEQALRTEPRNQRLRNNLGFAHAAEGDFVHAAQQFQLAGTPGEAKNNLGFAYERSGNLAQAFELYVEACKLQPAPRFRNNLEYVARKLGRALPPDLGTGAGTSERGDS
jgi:Flp pilus assembly protein TadD